MDPEIARGVKRAALQLLWPELAPESEESLDAESALMAETRAKAFRLYTRKRTMRQIADDLRVSPATVCRYVNHCLDGYRLIALQDAASHIARELGHIASIETELWESWEKSKGESIDTSSGKTDRGSTARVTKKQRHGDPRIMKLLLDAFDKRCRLLGLLSQDTKTAPGTPPVKLIAGINPEELV